MAPLKATAGKSSRYHLYLGGYSIKYRTLKIASRKVKVQFLIDDKYDFTNKSAKALTTYDGYRIGVRDSVWSQLQSKGVGKDFERKCFWTEEIDCCPKEEKGHNIK